MQCYLLSEVGSSIYWRKYGEKEFTYVGDKLTWFEAQTVCALNITRSALSPGTTVSTNKTDHHDIPEILLKVALNTIILTLNMWFEAQTVCQSLGGKLAHVNSDAENQFLISMTDSKF
jgi:hypothetical protein